MCLLFCGTNGNSLVLEMGHDVSVWMVMVSVVSVRHT